MMMGNTTVDASDLIQRSMETEDLQLVRADSYTTNKEITNYLIGILFLLMLLEILIVRGRGEL